MKARECRAEEFSRWPYGMRLLDANDSVHAPENARPLLHGDFA